MKKNITSILLSLAFFSVFAQKRETNLYFLTNSDNVVSTLDSADKFMLILPPDSSTDMKLFSVNEYYKSGKIRMMGHSPEGKPSIASDRHLSIHLEGPCISFFSNGKKMGTRIYKKGKIYGNVIENYPNGKLYKIIHYSDYRGFTYEQCNDSTGNVLAVDGYGKWISYNRNFEGMPTFGQIENGVPVGLWYTKKSDTVDFIEEYDKGGILYTSDLHKSGRRVYYKVQCMPIIPLGYDGFNKLLDKHSFYHTLELEKRKKSGRIIIQVVVLKDGTLTDIKVTNGIGGKCDEEALKAIKLSPRWAPGTLNGDPVECVVSIYFGFDLTSLK